MPPTTTERKKSSRPRPGANGRARANGNGRPERKTNGSGPTTNGSGRHGKKANGNGRSHVKANGNGRAGVKPNGNGHIDVTLNGNGKSSGPTAEPAETFDLDAIIGRADRDLPERCRDCGSELAYGDRFCRSCGFPSPITSELVIAEPANGNGHATDHKSTNGHSRNGHSRNGHGTANGAAVLVKGKPVPAPRVVSRARPSRLMLTGLLGALFMAAGASAAAYFVGESTRLSDTAVQRKIDRQVVIDKRFYDGRQAAAVVQARTDLRKSFARRLGAERKSAYADGKLAGYSSGKSDGFYFGRRQGLAAAQERAATEDRAAAEYRAAVKADRKAYRRVLGDADCAAPAGFGYLC